jgi:hypothetical protein
MNSRTSHRMRVWNLRDRIGMPLLQRRPDGTYR